MGILDRFHLDGKLALVTGSATGLGAAIAIALAEAGALVACHGNRRPAEETSEIIRSLGRGAKSFAADLSKPEGADSLYEAVLGSMGPPDILVNNAGTIYREQAESHELQAWLTVMQVNLNSVFRLCQLAGGPMIVISGWYSCARLCGIEGRRCAVDQGVGQRVGGTKCPGKRDRAGILSDRKYLCIAGG
jgi:2-dehydro-3-deoxy-D-gluconate 5-dehydrogenase